MSKRNSIAKALAEKLKTIDGTAPYTSNLYDNSYAKLKFWDEIQDFPAVYIVPGTEIREYHPADFAWCFLNLSLNWKPPFLSFIFQPVALDPPLELPFLLQPVKPIVSARTTNNFKAIVFLIFIL